MHTCHCTDIYIPNDDGHVMNRLSPPGRASSALFLKSPIYLSLISCPIYLCDFCLNMKLRDTAARAQRPMLSMSPGMAVWHNAALRELICRSADRPALAKIIRLDRAAFNLGVTFLWRRVVYAWSVTPDIFRIAPRSVSLRHQRAPQKRILTSRKDYKHIIELCASFIVIGAGQESCHCRLPRSYSSATPCCRSSCHGTIPFA